MEISVGVEVKEKTDEVLKTFAAVKGGIYRRLAIPKVNRLAGNINDDEPKWEHDRGMISVGKSSNYYIEPSEEQKQYDQPIHSYM